MRIFIWGTGEVAEKMCIECEDIFSYEILGFIDNDKEKEGKLFFNYRIFSPEIINQIDSDAIIVLSDSYDAIKKQIENEYINYRGIIGNKYFFYKVALIKRYGDTQDIEIQEIISYIRRHDLGVFNYEFAKKYKNYKCETFFDEDKQLFYVMHNKKRMYLSKKFKTKEAVEGYYQSIMLEQDNESPHRYLSENFAIRKGDVVVDAGVAEGNFSLDIVDYVSKLYIIEADDDWIEALQYTFKNYMDKVIIIKGYLSSYSDDKHITLDEVVGQPVDFIKMDIEGNEWDALNGAINVIQKSNNLRLAICSYHSDVDQELIESFMRKNGIDFEHSRGYMWFPYKLKQNYVSTKLNRGIIRGIKN